MNLVKDRGCFVCGEDNPEGFHLRVERDGEKGVKAEFLAKEIYRGWSRYLHGGVIGLIFDEMLGWTSYSLGYDSLTAKLEVKYRKPVPIGSKVIFRGRLEKEEKGFLFIRTEARLPDGTLAAEGWGMMKVIKRKSVL